MNTKWLIIIGVIIIGGATWAFFSFPGSRKANAQKPSAVDASEPGYIPRESDKSEDLEERARAEESRPDQNIAPVESSLVTPPEIRGEGPPSGAERSFTTDFSIHTVSYSEILSGGPPKDAIPAIDNPKFISVEEADTWLNPQEPVIFLQVGENLRAYPLQVLMWHEIVNDIVGSEPVTVTFCPLCNTAIAFERTFDGQILDFGTTGRLRFSNLIMYDRQSETWWQQATGEAIAGKYAGQQLTFLPASIISWEDYKSANPDGKVLSRETGFNRSYGRNPYAGYDDINNSPFAYKGSPTPGQLLPMERVLTVDLNDEAVAYPFNVLQEVGVVNDIIAEQPIVVFWEAGTASALDSGAVATGRDVGAANSFSRKLSGEILTFKFNGDQIVDEQTGSVWNVLGQSVEGDLAGSQLAPVVSVNHFWFSWAAFKPETRIFSAE